MTQLPPHLLTSFKEAWLKDHGVEISDEKANEYGLGLMDLVMTLARHPAAVRAAPKRFESHPASKKKPSKSETG